MDDLDKYDGGTFTLSLDGSDSYKDPISKEAYRADEYGMSIKRDGKYVDIIFKK